MTNTFTFLLVFLMLLLSLSAVSVARSSLGELCVGVHASVLLLMLWLLSGVGCDKHTVLNLSTYAQVSQGCRPGSGIAGSQGISLAF